MKTITPQFKDQSLASEATTLCSCWSIIRKDGVQFNLTNLDIPMTVNAVEYKPAIGYNESAVETSSDMSVDNMDVDGILDDETITIRDLRAGLFNHAEVRIFIVDWKNPEYGILRIRRGWLGEVTVSPQGNFRAELRGLNQAFSQQVGEQTSAECRADLGDGRCKVDINGPEYLREGEVSVVTNRKEFNALITDPDSRASDPSWYVGGIVTWLTGDNAGVDIECKLWDGVDKFTLFLSMPFAIQVGDTFQVRPGCDKKRTTCINKFNNILNMRAEPFTPGRDLMGTYPNAN